MLTQIDVNLRKTPIKQSKKVYDQEQVKAVRKLFAQYDRVRDFKIIAFCWLNFQDGSGAIDPDEFLVMVQSIGTIFKNQLLITENLVRFTNSNRRNILFWISLYSPIDISIAPEIDKPQMDLTFKSMDTDGDGTVNFMEFLNGAPDWLLKTVLNNKPTSSPIRNFYQSRRKLRITDDVFKQLLKAFEESDSDSDGILEVDKAVSSIANVIAPVFSKDKFDPVKVKEFFQANSNPEQVNFKVIIENFFGGKLVFLRNFQFFLIFSNFSNFLIVEFLKIVRFLFLFNYIC